MINIKTIETKILKEADNIMSEVLKLEEKLLFIKSNNGSLSIDIDKLYCAYNIVVASLQLGNVKKAVKFLKVMRKISNTILSKKDNVNEYIEKYMIG